MEFLDLFLVPISNILEWWTMLWSRDPFILNLFLAVIFANLCFKFLIDPLIRGDAGSDRADQHPRKK